MTNQLLVITSLVDDLGKIIDAAFLAGANRLDSVSFDIDSETQQKIKDDLISKATLKAYKKA